MKKVYPTNDNRPGLNNPNALSHLNPVARGDVSSWARATTRAVRPEVRGLRHVRPCEPIHDLATLKTTYAMPEVRHEPGEVVLMAVALKADDESVAAAMRSCEKRIELAESMLAASDRVNRALAALSSGGGVVREYV